MKLTVAALMIAGASAEIEAKPIALPNCLGGDGKVHLEARRYKYDPKVPYTGCNYIGQPGTKLLGGFDWGGGELTLSGSMHVEGTVSVSGGSIYIHGYNGGITFDGKGEAGFVNTGYSIEGDVRFENYILSKMAFMGFRFGPGDLHFKNSTIDGMDMGHMTCNRTRVTLVDTIVRQIYEAEFEDAVLTVEGKSSFHGQDEGGEFTMSFTNSTATFMHSDKVIQVFSEYINSTGFHLDASRHSAVTFKECTSFARVIVPDEYSPKLRKTVMTRDSDSKIFCSSSANEPTIV